MSMQLQAIPLSVYTDFWESIKQYTNQCAFTSTSFISQKVGYAGKYRTWLKLRLIDGRYSLNFTWTPKDHVGPNKSFWTRVRLSEALNGKRTFYVNRDFFNKTIPGVVEKLISGEGSLQSFHIKPSQVAPIQSIVTVPSEEDFGKEKFHTQYNRLL